MRPRQDAFESNIDIIKDAIMRKEALKSLGSPNARPFFEIFNDLDNNNPADVVDIFSPKYNAIQDYSVTPKTFSFQTNSTRMKFVTKLIIAYQFNTAPASTEYGDATVTNGVQFQWLEYDIEDAEYDTVLAAVPWKSNVEYGVFFEQSKLGYAGGGPNEFIKNTLDVNRDFGGTPLLIKKKLPSSLGGQSDLLTLTFADDFTHLTIHWALAYGYSFENRNYED